MLMRMALTLTLALMLAAPAVAQEDDAPAPLLQAMAYLHLRREPVSVSFADWAQLKRLHGAEGVTSASPLEDRQRFLLEVARNESLPVPLGLDRLATWAETWGWDNTDLDWQARYGDGRNVLHFGEHWDPASFRAALESSGFERDVGGRTEVWLPPDTRLPSELLLERVGMEIDAPETTLSFAPLTISDDGRTVVVHTFGGGASPKQLRSAARPNLERIVKTPAVRAAAALGDVVAGNVAASRQMLCDWPGEGHPAQDPEVTAAVEELHRYRARAEGYTRPTANAPVGVRYVFSYQRPRQARADLEGRSALVEMGHPWGPLATGLTLVDARVEEKELILDVEPEYGHPGPYTGWHVAWATFAMCRPAD